MKIEFFRHNIGEAEIDLVVQTLHSTFLTTGPRTAQFEKNFSEYLGNKYTIGLSSCTAGLFLALKALNVGPGHEVITTPMTFIATANAILHTGATPVFVDVEPATGNIDADKIEQAITPKTRAIVPVHLYGHMCDMNRIQDIAKKHRLYVIEDSAHCIEGEREGVRPGHLSEAAVFSFYATKNITSGEGGAICTNDASLYENLLKYRLHGMTKSAIDRYSRTYQHWDMELLGYKGNMNDIQASLLLPQLDRIEEILRRKEDICKRYESAFRELQSVDFPGVLPATKHARHLFTIWVNPNNRDEILTQLQEAQIGIAVNFRAIHLLTYYTQTYGFTRGDFPVAERIGDSTISLPMYAKMTDEDVEYVIDRVRTICG
jgi:dTDP-4-amino-4,6-dideoxygalactose transaminase